MNNLGDSSRSELRDLGLNDREARVYLALLNQGEATATQLAVATRIPQNKIYTPLEGLLEAGLCQRQRRGRQSIFIAIDPAVSMARPILDLQARLDNAKAFSKDLAGIFASARPNTASIGDVEILQDREAIRERYLQLLESTRQEIAGFARGPYAFESRDDLAAQFDQGRRLTENCSARWVYELVPDRDPLLVEFLKDYDNKGDVRVSDHLPLKMVVFDRKTIIFTDDAPDDPAHMGVAIMHHPAVVRAFMSLFDFFWEDSLQIADWFKKKN